MRVFLEKYGIAIFIIIILGIMILMANGLGDEIKKKEKEEINKTINDNTEKKIFKEYPSLDLPPYEDSSGYNIWTDGDKIYYSGPYYKEETDEEKILHYELKNGEWISREWDGFDYFAGNFVWTDGTNTYYSLHENHYVLKNDKWEPITWNGLTNFGGSHVWNHNGKTYYSCIDKHYILDRNTWIKVEWSGIDHLNGTNIWTDGKNTYYSEYETRYNEETNESENIGQYHYILKNDHWEPIIWKGIDEFYGINVWFDNKNTYYSNEKEQYVLKNDTWVKKEWNGINKFYGVNIWTDGINYYSTENGKTYLIK